MLSVPENWWKQNCRTVKKTCRDCPVTLKMGLDGIHPKRNKGLEVNFEHSYRSSLCRLLPEPSWAAAYTGAGVSD